MARIHKFGEETRTYVAHIEQQLLAMQQRHPALRAQFDELAKLLKEFWPADSTEWKNGSRVRAVLVALGRLEGEMAAEYEMENKMLQGMVKNFRQKYGHLCR